MQAVIFAAGKSTRTLPLTLDKPKPLLKIAGRTIIGLDLEQLSGLVDEAIIVIGYKGDMIRQELGSSYRGMRLSYVVQDKADGNASALKLTKDMLKDRFIAMVGDDIYSGKDIKRCLPHRYCVLTKEVDELSRFGEVIVSGKRVVSIEEKPDKQRGLASTGLFVLDKRVFDHEVKKSKRGEYELTDIIKMLAKDCLVDYEAVEDYWLPITYPWNMLEANKALLSKLKAKNLGRIEKGATVKGDVMIGKGTFVRAGAYIEGPVLIGEGCAIGPNCYIRPYTSIGNGCKVGNGVEIKNSVLGNNTSVGHLSYIGDSILANNVNIGAGTITANLRHDKANVKSLVKGELVDTGLKKLGAILADNVCTGIQTSFYPGRKMWPGTTTLPGEIVKRDIGG